MIKRFRSLFCVTLAAVALSSMGCIEAVRVGFTSGLEGGISTVIEQWIEAAAAGVGGAE